MKAIDCTDCCPEVREFVDAAEKACSFLDHCAPGMGELAAMTAAAAEVQVRIANALADEKRVEDRLAKRA